MRRDGPGTTVATVFVALVLATSARAAPPADGAGLEDTAAAIVAGYLAGLEVRDEPAQALRLVEAVKVAVENNPGLRAKAEVPNIVSQEILKASAAFEPLLAASSDYGELEEPNTSILEGGTPVFKAEEIQGEVGLSKKLATTGGEAGVAWTNERESNNSRLATLKPTFRSNLTFSLEQPLLRDFAAITDRTTVLTAKNDSRQARADFAAELADFIAEVVGAYWDHTGVSATLEVRRHSLALARELVREAEAKVDVGVLPPVAVQEALAEAASREEQVLRAENDLALATRTLQYKVMLPLPGSRVPALVTPGEEHVVDAVEIDRRHAVRDAVAARAEVRSAGLERANSELEEKRARNGKLPDLRFVGSYEFVGVRGEVRPIEREGDDPFLSPFDGSYGDTLADLFGEDYFRYRVGVELEVPLSNAAARAEFAQASIEVRRATRALQDVVAEVGLEVEQALAELQSATKRVEASGLSRELAEENLHNQQRRFELGAVTTKDVLDFQQQLSEAMAAEVEAVTDHALAEVELARARGTLLARFGVEVDGDGDDATPWWSRF